jgi:hypothetical protein
MSHHKQFEQQKEMDLTPKVPLTAAVASASTEESARQSLVEVLQNREQEFPELVDRIDVDFLVR